jgi:acyl-CoA thioesterase
MRSVPLRKNLSLYSGMAGNRSQPPTLRQGHARAARSGLSSPIPLECRREERMSETRATDGQARVGFLDGQPSGPGARASAYPELDAATRTGIVAFFDADHESFGQTIGMRVADVRRGYARLELDVRPGLKQPAGVLHGGASFGLADTAVAIAMRPLYGIAAVLLTIEMKINYLEPIVAGTVTAEAYVLRSSRRSAYAEVDVWTEGKLAARATTTYMIRDARPPEAPRAAT